VLLVTFDPELEWKNPFTPYASAGQQDAAIAGTQMMLEATNLGLGSCWVSYFDFKKVLTRKRSEVQIF
jgi:nitroreductase